MEDGANPELPAGNVADDAAADQAQSATQPGVAGTSSFAGIDPELLSQLISSTVSTSVAAVLQAQAQAAPTSSGRPIKASDLPVFKGFSLDGADASAFLEALDTHFELHSTTELHKTKYASLAFPVGTPAHSWYREQRDLGLFRQHHDPPDLLRYNLFQQAFLARFSTPVARRYALEDLWDKFVQKGTVADHHVKFTKLWSQLQQLSISLPADVVASKYLRSLKPELFQSVCNKNRELPDLDTVHRQAIEAEYQLKPSANRPNPQFRGIFPAVSQTRGDPNYEQKKGDKWCILHKWNHTHTTQDCRRVKTLKEKGEWKTKE